DEHQDGARLGVRGDVGQRVGLAEPFIPGRADTSGDIHLALHDVAPQASRHVDVGVEPGQDTNVGERHHQREAVDRVTDRFALLEHRYVGLIVPAAVDRVGASANVEIVLGEIQVLSVVSGAIQLDAVDRVAFAAGERRIGGGEVVVETRGGRDRIVEQIFPAGGQIESGRDFESAVP